jgi:hypothetical protein
MRQFRWCLTACVFAWLGSVAANSQEAPRRIPDLPPHCATWRGKWFGDCPSLIKERAATEALIMRENDIHAKFVRLLKRRPDEPAVANPIATYCEDAAALSCEKSKAVASLYSIDDFAVVVAHGTYSSGQHQVCATERGATDRRCKAIARAISEGRLKYRGPEYKQVKVTVVGHSDLFPATTSVTAIPEHIRNTCQEVRKYKHIEDCLALARAYDLKAMVDEQLVRVGANRFIAQYIRDADPFMKTTNTYLRGSLYDFLKLSPVVDSVKLRLGIGQEWDADTMRARAPAILANARDLAAVLEPFRSVVVVLEPCGGKGIECE